MTRYIRLGLIEEYAHVNIRKAGVFTTVGKLRAVVATALTVGAERTNLAKTLGLRRHTKQVDLAASFTSERS